MSREQIEKITINLFMFLQNYKQNVAAEWVWHGSAVSNCQIIVVSVVICVLLSSQSLTPRLRTVLARTN